MKIAILSTMNLPTPAVAGGAVEMLTTNLLDENEKKSNIKFDVYTMYDERINENQYKNTKIIPIRVNFIERLYQKVRNLLNRIIGKRPVYNILYQKAAKLLLKQKYDKIVVENNMFIYNLIKDKTNTEMIYHMHNDFNESDKTSENYIGIVNSASRIITVSNYIKNRCNNVIKTNKIDVLYNAIDDKLYIPECASTFRDRYNINKDDIVIGYSGRITEEKGILELVKAIKSINTKKSIKLLIVGTQWYSELKRDNYITKIEQEMETIKDKVIFTGYIQYENMPSIYNTMDILVIPTIIEEAFGCVAIEGMAMGKPLVVTKSGALPEIVKENFGFIINKDHKLVENMSKSIKKLVENETLRKGFGEKARIEFIENKNYHKDQYYKNFINILNIE